MNDNRQHHRHDVQYHAGLSIDNLAFCAKIRNLSPRSALLSTDASLTGILAEGKRVCLIFTTKALTAQVLWGKIVRIFKLNTDKTAFAVHFETDSLV